MRMIRIALCERLACRYANASHRSMREARSARYETVGFGTQHRFFGGEITLKDITELPPTAGRKDFVLQRKIWFTASYKFGWAAEKLH